MKHIKLFENFVELNEDRMEYPDMLNSLLSGNDSVEVLTELKKEILKNGIATERILKAAKMISWTASEVKDLVKASEGSFDELEEFMDSVDKGDIEVRPGMVSHIKAALKDKARVLQAVRSL
jgi:hypothetical protein